MKDILKAVVFGGLFAIPFLTLYVENDYFFPFITGKNFWFRILVDITVAAWIILALTEVRYRPKISGIVWSFGALLVIMFFANLFGVHPNTSFWSNFERMDGYVSLVHTFLYMLVLGSMLQTKKHWKILLNVSLVVATLVALRGLQQYLGITEGATRIDSTLGNAAYMAVYMLFHVFITFWLFVESRVTWQRVVYALLLPLFVFVLIETGTRGTAVGLAVGVLVMSAYIGLFGAQFQQFRKYALGGFAILAIAIAGFITFRDSAFIQDNSNLSRIANISIDDLEIRSIIWGMAWEGVQERPVLGYGQGNFNFVFNENYDPRLYDQEQWFDRAHNIFMDWLIAGGFLGLIAYLSIFAWCGWYLFLRPLRDPSDESFNVLERGVLLGILAGYFTHNLVVFDNIVSYIFFAIILGLINSRVGSIPNALAEVKVDKLIVQQFAAPVVAVALIAVIYFWHVPGMQAAGYIIDGFREQDPQARLEAFERAVAQDSFAEQEITEQLAQQAMNLVRTPDVPDEVRAAFMEAAERELANLIEAKPNDARIHVFVGSYYRATNQPELAREQFARARELSPRKQTIIIQQGFTELALGQNDAAVEFFREAFELDERNEVAREYYAGALFYADEPETAIALMETEEAERRFAASDFVISGANQAGQTDFVIDMFEYRVNTEPDSRQSWAEDPQTWATLAFLYYQQDQTDRAVEVLNQGAEKIPSFAETASCFAENIEAGNEPQAGCQ